MMDPFSGLNRGYAFVTFCSKEAAQQAVKLVSVFMYARIMLNITVIYFLLLFSDINLCLFLIFPQCNNNEIRPGKQIGVCISVANNRLFVGSIPKSKTKDQIVEEFAKVTGESKLIFS